jgi:hypothetical protein
MSYSQFIVDNDDALHRIGFVSATEGELLDEEFPECANAYLYQVDMEHSNNENYRAAHHAESEFRIEKMPVKMSNNAYAEKLIQENLAYFTSPVEGTNYYRKIIVNSNAKAADMTSMAHFANSCGINAMVFNMYGVKTYIPDTAVQTSRIKGKKFNEVLFSIYKTLKMENKPLIIIGRRKVDRGLGFHYAPRDGTEGLIWTDIILGKIEDANTAVQKAGRLAGIIGQCAQYYGKCTYWTDERTQRDILRHNRIVDEANKLSGCTVLQAVTRGTVKVDELLSRTTNKDAEINNYRVFTSEEMLKSACKIMGYKYIVTKDKTPDGFFETSLNSKKAVALLEDAICKVKSAYGTNNGKTSYRTYYPCYQDLTNASSLSYVFIIRPKSERESIEEYNTKIQKMDSECV